MKINKIIAFTCLLISTSISYAQSENIIIGKKSDGTPLEAQCYTLPQRAETFSISYKEDYLCIVFRETTKNGKQLKDKGEIGFYDLKGQELLWKRPINFSKSRVTSLSEGVLLAQGGNKVSLLSKETGERKWETDLLPIYVDDSLDLLLGYSSAMSNTLRAVYLKYGNDLWQKKIAHQYGWDQVVNTEGNQRLIVADNLHQLDFITGDLRTYPGSPGASDTKAALLQGLAAVAGAAAGIAASGGKAYSVYVPAGPNTITSLNSNILMHNSHYYWADRKQISCIDTTMNAVWQTKLSDSRGSKSWLFVQDDKLFMLNYGYGLANGISQRKYGRPFIACYNLENGEEVFFNRLSMKKDVIEDAVRTKEALYMLFDDGLAYQNLTDSVVNITPWDTKQYSKLQGMLFSTFYIANEDTTAFKPLHFDGEYCLVYNDQNTIYEINKELDIVQTYNPSQIYSTKFKLKDYLCINNKNDYWFIHEIGMPVAHFQAKIKKGRVIDNKLLLLNDKNQLLFIDLDEAIK